MTVTDLTPDLILLLTIRPKINLTVRKTAFVFVPLIWDFVILSFCQQEYSPKLQNNCPSENKKTVFFFFF
jgi:hypothetical protein